MDHSKSHSRVRVLIVEDDDDSRDMLGELIALLGHEALGAANATEALRQAREAEPSVALVDLDLPDIGGCELARRLRACPAGPSMRLIALTGFSDEPTRKIALEAGFDEFVVKPLMPDALEALLSGPRDKAESLNL
jgi:CheY-like chemotaxis protein